METGSERHWRGRGSRRIVISHKSSGWERMIANRTPAGAFDSERRAVLSRFAAAAILLGTAKPLFEPRAARAAQVSPDDPRLIAERVQIDNGAGGLQSYSARPAAAGQKRGGVLVMHDILGLTPHFEDVARRFAAEGFVALAPDYASRYGGTPAERGPALEVVGMATWPDMIADTHAALAWLRTQGDANGKTAAVGYGLGGSALGRALMEPEDLSAAVVLYGRTPPLDHVSAAHTPLLLIYAGDDPAVNDGVPAYLSALQETDLRPEVVTYPHVQHGFDDDTASARYAPEAAAQAWARTLDFLRPRLA
jgi:carboxymethylenebutenolidase